MNVKEYPLDEARAKREVPLMMPCSDGNQMAFLVAWLRWIHKMPLRAFAAAIGRTKSPFTGGSKEDHPLLREACFSVAAWVCESMGVDEKYLEELSSDFVDLLGTKRQGFDEADSWRGIALWIQDEWLKGQK